MVGEGMPPPNVPYCPKPQSSMRISRMFGAPFGAATGLGNRAGSESRYVRPTSPVKWKSGLGRMLGVLATDGSTVGMGTLSSSLRVCERTYAPSVVYWTGVRWRADETTEHTVTCTRAAGADVLNAAEFGTAYVRLK